MAAADLPLLHPDWPAPAGVHAVCTTRAGGVSLPPYDSLNLGDHVGDDPACVDRNRALLAAALGVRPVFMQQVHGSQVAQLTDSVADGVRGDGCMATLPGLACTIMVADCLPVLFCTPDGAVVAAAHAGWRGLAGDAAGGVLEAVVQLLVGRSQCQPADVLAWLGPCIGPDAFEVGGEVKAAFEQFDPAAVAHFMPHAAGKWLGDLQALARQRLAALGVTRVFGNDGTRQWCTVSNPSRFFSHRRDRVCGRFAVAIWRS